MIRAIKTYIPPGQPAPLSAFLVSLDEKLRRKLLRQIFQLSQIPLCDLKEPHYKHFVLEKYSQFYELPGKKQGPRPNYFYDSGRGYYFAHAFHQAAAPGDTMKAWSIPSRYLANIRESPEFAVNFNVLEEVK